jgi:hypothetical protein
LLLFLQIRKISLRRGMAFPPEEDEYSAQGKCRPPLFQIQNLSLGDAEYEKDRSCRDLCNGNGRYERPGA